MPCKPQKARWLLKHGKAKVVRREPFTIQLTIPTGEAKQDISLGVDAGSKQIGISATTDKEVLFEGEFELRNDIVELLSDKRQYRRSRRYRKTRYRKPRFLNRKKPQGWLAPSVQHKVNSHIKVVNFISRLLPITKVTIEVVAFDIHKIKNPDIQGKGYQQGDQLGFWNVREYVLWRDGHQCQGKKGCKGKILNVHHIVSRKISGDTPNNLITLYENCHRDYHFGKLKLDLKYGQSFKDATFMGIMRWSVYNKLKELYPDVNLTYGYITKHTRINAGLGKSHRTDTRCISGNVLAKPLDYYYYYKFVRKQNRQLHKANIFKGGIRKANKSPRYVYGFQLFDKVIYNSKECFIFGRHSSGYFDLRKLDGTKIHTSANYKQLSLVGRAKTILCERRIGNSSPTYAVA